MTADHHHHHGHQDEPSHVDVPERFICPLTLEIMEHPLMTIAGHSFERSAILAWLRRNDHHPLTREILSPRDLVMNGALKAEIAQWKLKHRSDHSDGETDASSDEEAIQDVNQFLFISSVSLGDLLFEHTRDAVDTAVATTTRTHPTSASMDAATSSRRRRRPRFFGMRRRR